MTERSRGEAVMEDGVSCATVISPELTVRAADLGASLVSFRRRFACAVVLSALSAGAFAGERPNDLLYVSPIPGARLVRAETGIIVRWKDWQHTGRSQQEPLISAQGVLSGEHSGRLVVADDRRTLVFEPQAPFLAGEEVWVTLRSPKGAVFSYSFTVSPGPVSRPLELAGDVCLEAPGSHSGGRRSESLRQARAAAPGLREAANSAMPAGLTVSVPSDFPSMAVSQFGETAEGKLFFSNWGGTPYLMIMEDDGTPVFYRRMPSFARDLKVQSNGTLSYHLGGDALRWYVMDSSYTVIDSVECGNGYETDEHELLILPNGHFLLIGKDYQRVDMSQIVFGGRVDATVVGNTVQELDRDHTVVFEWRSWDHFEITDCEHVVLTTKVIDYVHMNAIEVDRDGNLLISSRNMSEVTKIDRTTGEIIWRWGGKNSMVSMVDDPLGFSYQHDIRSIGNGHYTLYDNGSYHDPAESRPVEYLLDTTAMTATLVWDYRHYPIRYSWWLGSVQRLSNGNTLVGWGDGDLPVLTELSPDGSIVYELEFEQYAHCYRARRFPWSGKAARPYLLAEARNDTARLVMNTFGDSSVVGYRIFGGTSPGAQELLDTSSSTMHDLLGLEGGIRYYLRVAAVDSTGTQGPFSDEVSVQLRSSLPGDDMVLNGDFSHGLDEWVFVQEEGAIARAWVNQAGECRVDISLGGPQTWSVQLRQEGFEIRNGRQYLFEFKARALASRSAEVKIEESRLGGKNYSRTGTIAVGKTWRDYSFSFTMVEPTDLNARMVFNCGKSNTEILFDQITLREILPSEVSPVGLALPGSFALRGAYPNPFNPSTELRYDVPEAARVSLVVYTVLGQVAAQLFDEQREPGSHLVRFDARGLASGVYLCRMTATSDRTGERYNAVIKLMLMK